MNINKWKLKGCPRCNGDLFIGDDEENCLQCGYEKSRFSPGRQKQPHGKGYARHNYKVLIKA